MWGNLLKPPSSGAFVLQDIEMIPVGICTVMV
jgi:hypothetical protein